MRNSKSKRTNVQHFPKVQFALCAFRTFCRRKWLFVYSNIGKNELTKWDYILCLMNLHYSYHWWYVLRKRSFDYWHLNYHKENVPICLITNNNEPFSVVSNLRNMIDTLLRQWPRPILYLDIQCNQCQSTKQLTGNNYAVDCCYGNRSLETL